MVALGIDFGTTTSTFAFCEPMRLKMLTDDQGEDIIPSVVAFTPQGKTQIGKQARSRILIDPANTLFSVKRILGRQWHSPDVTAFRKQYPFEIERGDDGTPQFITRAGKLSPIQVTEFFLAHVRGYQSIASQTPKKTIVAIPEAADTRQREATLEAAAQAGFLQAEEISEPAAATLAYLYEEAGSHMVLVFDLGGGTFDAAVVRWDKQQPIVRASLGDSYLGGDDIDTMITDWAAQEILHQYQWDVTTSANSRQILRFICEQAKVRLSIAESTALNLTPVDEVLRGKTLMFSREQLLAFVRPLMERAVGVCRNSLDLAGTLVSDLDAIVMAGGTTFMPYVRHLVKEAFDRELLTKLPADRLVAMGAAVMGQKRLRGG